MKGVIVLLGLVFCLAQQQSAAAQEPAPTLRMGDYPSPIAPENATSYTLVIDNTSAAYVEGYTYDGGLLLSLDQFFKALHFTTDFNPDTYITSGWYKNPKQGFTLDIARGQVRFGKVVKPYSPRQVIATPHGVYVDLHFLYHYFHFDIAVDYQGAKLRLKHLPPLENLKDQEEARMTLPSELSGAPASPVETPDPLIPSPRMPPEIPTAEVMPSVPPQVTDEAVAHHTTDIEIIRPEPGVSPIKEEQPPALHLEKKVSPVANNYLSFEMSIKNLTYDELLDIYKQDNNFYIGIKQLSRALQFAIKVDEKNSSASGWFIKEENTFQLDIPAHQATIAGKDYALSPGDAFVDNGDIFVLKTLLQQWLPLNITINFNAQILNIDPTVLLPMQAQKEREQAHDSWKQRQKLEKKYPPYIVPYGERWEWPFADITVGSELASSKDGSALTTEYSAIFSGDMGWLNTEWFATGTNKEFSDLRVTGSRRDADGKLLGTLGLTSLEVGDVNSFETELVNGSGLGRGVAISNFPLERATQFDTTTIQGTERPGWEVELYNNTTLIAFLTIGADGRYEFHNVPVLYGNNAIKLVFYGPQGEIREEIKHFSIADAVIKQGKYNYQLSVNEVNKNLIPVKADNTEGQMVAVGQVEYGVTDRLTATYSSNYNELGDGEHLYQSLGVATSLLEDVITQAATVYDTTTGGSAVRLTANTSYHDVGIRMQQELFNNFNDQSSQNNSAASSAGSGADSSLLNDLSLDASSSSSGTSSSGSGSSSSSSSTGKLSTTSLDLNGTLNLPTAINVPYTLKAKYEFFKNNTAITSLDNSLTTSMFGFSFTNRLGAVLQDSSGINSTDINGTISARGRYRDAVVRLDTGYDVYPDAAFQDITLSTQRSLTEKLNARVDIRKALTGNRQTSLAGVLNWDARNYRISTRLEGDDQNNFLIGVNVSFSLYQDPRTRAWHMENAGIAEAGMASARAFLDKNHNNILDGDEKILPEIGYGKFSHPPQRNEDGSTTIAGLTANSFTTVVLDTGTLEDAFWQPTQEGYAVLGRPGVTALIDFPVVETSEIDGTVYLGNDPIPGITVYLLTRDGRQVMETKTEFDGQYLFEKVTQGDYHILLSDEQLQSLGVRVDKNLDISIPGGSEVYESQNFTLEKTTKESTDPAGNDKEKDDKPKTGSYR